MSLFIQLKCICSHFCHHKFGTNRNSVNVVQTVFYCGTYAVTVCVCVSVLQPDWTFVLGEQALDLCVPSFSHSSASIFVLGERNLYCLRDNGQIRFMKKLEFNPSCFLPYTSGKPGC